MRPTSTGDECEMNIQPLKAIRFYRAPPAEKHTAEKPTSIRKNPALDKERDNRERTYRKSLLLCTIQLANFLLVSLVFFFGLQKEMQVGEIGWQTIEVSGVNLTLHAFQNEAKSLAF